MLTHSPNKTKQDKKIGCNANYHETPLHSKSPSMFTHPPFTMAFSHPIITARSLQPMLDTVHTILSLLPRTARSIRYALPTSSRNRKASAVGGRFVSGLSMAVAGTEE